jgi:hypothetical protein
MRHHPREPGGIHQDVGAAELVGDRGRDPADLRGILKRQMHRAMSSSGQLAYELLGTIETSVIAYDDPRAGSRQAACAGSADTAATAGHDRNPTGKGELVFCCQLRSSFF